MVSAEDKIEQGFQRVWDALQETLSKLDRIQATLDHEPEVRNIKGGDGSKYAWSKINGPEGRFFTPCAHADRHAVQRALISGSIRRFGKCYVRTMIVKGGVWTIRKGSQTDGKAYVDAKAQADDRAQADSGLNIDTATEGTE